MSSVARGVSALSTHAPAANTTPTTVHWNGSIPASGTVTISIIARIALPPPDLTGQIVSSQGTVNFDADGNGTNESSVLTTNDGSPGAVTFAIVKAPNIPALSPAGLMLLFAFIALAGWITLRRTHLAD